MASKKKVDDPTHRALRPIKHDGDYYAVGDTIHLTDEQAENLGDDIVVRLSGDATKVASAAIDLQSLTKAQLVDHAQKVHGVELDPAENKAALIESINDAAKKDAQ